LPLAKTVKLDDFDGETLRSSQNQTNLFTRLKEILTAQKSVGAFVVVRLQVPNPDEAPVGDEPKPVHLRKLVEKWRTRFANTHKIFADRFVVLFTTAPEFHTSHLRIWIVPKGHALPDPHEKEVFEDDDP
jgi:hypothetical protein